MRQAIIAVVMLLVACGGRSPHGGWEAGFVEANGIRLHYGRTGAGSGKPVLVLVHGVADSGACWASLSGRLEDTYDVVFYDVRGHGLSDKPASGYLVEDHVNDLVALLAALGIDRPILMGHSMGGGIVAQAVSERPAVACAVILEDPAFFPLPEDVRDVLEGSRSFLQSLRNGTREQLLARVTSENPGWPPGETDPWVEAKLQVTPRVIETIGDLPNIAELLPRIRVPTLLIKADAPPEQRQRHIADAAGIAQGTLIHIDGAGHAVHRDKPVAVERAIRDFLAANR